MSSLGDWAGDETTKSGDTQEGVWGGINSREFNFKYIQVEEPPSGWLPQGHSSEDTQSYIILDLRGEAGPRIVRICRLIHHCCCWNHQTDIFHRNRRLSTLLLKKKKRKKEKEGGDYEENGKWTLWDRKIAPGQNSWVSSSKGSTPQMLPGNQLEQGMKRGHWINGWGGIHDTIMSVFNGVVRTRGKINGKWGHWFIYSTNAYQVPIIF